MKYALTFTIDPNTCDWESVDTVLFEYPDTDTLPEGEELKDLVMTVIHTEGWRLDTAQEVASDSSLWFIRNCADTDVVINKKGE